jgi:hypothetical protein
MKRWVAVCLQFVVVLLFASGSSNAAEWRFPLGLTYVSGFKDVVDNYKNNLRERGYTVTESFNLPVGFSFQPYVQFENGLGIGAGIGPFMFAMFSGAGDYDFYAVPVNVNVRFTFLPKANISPYIRAGGSYHIAGGDFVKESKPGFLGGIGIEFFRTKRVGLGLEASYNSSEITFEKDKRVSGILNTKGEENIKPSSFMFSIFAIF